MTNTQGKRSTRTKLDVKESQEYLSLSEENQTLKEHVVEVETMKRKLIELENQNKNIRKFAKKTQAHHVTDDESTMIYQLTKTHIYPKCQYINDHTQLDMATRLVYTEQKFSRDSFEDFSIRYSDHVLATINKLRNASVQKMKASFLSELLIL